MMRTSKVAAILAAVVAFSVTLFGQAAAEGALTHALSSAAGSTAATAMGGAANQLAGRVGQRVSSSASTHQVPAVKNVPRKATPAQAAPAASVFGRSLIASIQGGEATDASSTSSGKGTDDHPSVINLPATK